MKSMNYGTNNNKIPLKTIFLANSGGFSSKRILGALGFCVCIIIYIIGFALEKQIPEYGEILLAISASLVGIDSVTNIWNK